VHRRKRNLPLGQSLLYNHYPANRFPHKPRDPPLPQHQLVPYASLRLRRTVHQFHPLRPLLLSLMCLW